jgi:predicted ribosomally synthesized peptide with SipW-like signal peptide
VKKILFSLIALVMVIGLAGGVFAYFSDVEKSTNNEIGAKTLDIQIGDNNEGYNDSGVTASFSSPSNLAPGESFTTGPVYINNVGTMDIRYIWARFCNLIETTGTTTDMELAVNPANNINDISKYLKLISVSESNNEGISYATYTFDTDTANAFLDFWNSRGGSFTLDGEISLYDLYVARNYGSGDHVTSLVLLNVVADFGTNPLPVGQKAAFKFTFQLDPAVTNAYQGDIAKFEVDFIGSARDAYPDDELADSGLDSLLGD